VEIVRRGPARVASLGSVLHSASKAPAEHLRALVDVIGPRLVEGWGMTENSGGLITATTERDYLEDRPGIYDSAGRAVPGTLVDVVDADGAPLPHDGATVGQLVARSGALARGYWNNPEATASTFRDGWYHTGDLGFVDADGYVTIMDRRADLIVSGGMNVYPSEVERVLLTAPGVAECAVVAADHPRWGQTPVAFVVGRPGEDVDPGRVLDHCREHLASYKLPTALHTCAELPRNASGKTLRARLAELAARGAAPGGGE
jgi:acyl-CoA synthetase (AMP-forming)/AMP-acid ligase II